MDARAERRGQPRIRPEEPVTFQIVWSPCDPTRRSQQFNGRGVDFSPGGLRLELEFPLPIGHPLQIIVELPERGQQFLLMCRVVWTGQVENEPTHLIGTEISSVPGSDGERWNALFD